jgi:hypothetical protein
MQLIVIFACFGAVAAQSCLDPEQKVDCINCDFSNKEDIKELKSKSEWERGFGYARLVPKGWQVGGHTGGILVQPCGCC